MSHTTIKRAYDVLVTDYKDCPRCGGDHLYIKWKRLTNMPITIDGVPHNGWAFCPVTGDPILIAGSQ